MESFTKTQRTAICGTMQTLPCSRTIRFVMLSLLCLILQSRRCHVCISLLVFIDRCDGDSKTVLKRVLNEIEVGGERVNVFSMDGAWLQDPWDLVEPEPRDAASCSPEAKNQWDAITQFHSNIQSALTDRFREQNRRSMSPAPSKSRPQKKPAPPFRKIQKYACVL